MVLQVQDRIEVRVQIKIVSAICMGSVADEAKSSEAKWVVLDRKLKQEIKHCIKELRCNIIVMKNSQANVLRLNLGSPNDLQTPLYTAASLPVKDNKRSQSPIVKLTAPISGSEDPNTSSRRFSFKNPLSCPSKGSFTYSMHEDNPLFEGLDKGCHPTPRLNTCDQLRAGTTESETCSSQSFWVSQDHTLDVHGMEDGNFSKISKSTFTSGRTELENAVQYRDDELTEGTELNQHYDGDCMYNSSIREAVSLRKKSRIPPPLCILCKSKAPKFGEPPKQFHYKVLEEATDGFSHINFLAEGRFGMVHRGVLKNGLSIAVKQLKFSGHQRDDDFCREVCVLSCAQHRNVVLLTGFCIHGKKRLLVYEYICNRSLDSHLHGNGNPVLDWQTRLRIAIGTARGLRYLHEDCRVGCIIHRNLRPSKILLTHDFEPLVADFGVARLHNERDLSDSNQIVGTSWYLSPEYFNGGEMTEKVDIYAFGLVLLELITGQRAQYCLEHEFPHILGQLLDRRLATHSLPYQLHAMGSAASLCLHHHPHLRPSMSKVVKILEGASQVTRLPGSHADLKDQAFTLKTQPT
ncbi:hypothetical protein ACS0TY_023801 [Phlomoides rotata]